MNFANMMKKRATAEELALSEKLDFLREQIKKFRSEGKIEEMHQAYKEIDVIFKEIEERKAKFLEGKK